VFASKSKSEKNNHFLLRNSNFLLRRCSQAQKAKAVAEVSSHLCLGRLRGLLLSGLSTKIFHAFPASPYSIPRPSHLPLFLHYSILRTILMTNNLIANLQAPPRYFLSHSPNTLPLQSLYYPTNVHNVKNAELLKHVKTMEAAPTCFGLQRNHHQGATTSA